ncbi:MAG: hypothetical protein GXY74_15490 [Phycisphaerae bacterium]|nr:hypothetical protein [Phycisphaerae bacterium]
MAENRQKTAGRTREKRPVRSALSLTQLRSYVTPQEAARLLTCEGQRPVTADDVRRLIERGAPGRGGKVRLVDLIAWMARETEAR